MAAEPAPRNTICWSFRLLAGHADRAQDRAERDGRRALDVVVEGEQLVAVALAGSGRACGVAKSSHCRQRSGKLLLDGLHEPVDEVEVRLTGHALVAPAEVLGIVEALRVVGADVEHDRQRPLRADAADERVERELADRDAEAADALVADAQDALAVGDDDDVDLADSGGSAAARGSSRAAGTR